MKIKFDVKDEPTNEVYVGQVRKDEHGVFAIISHGRTDDKDKPFNAYLFTESEDHGLYGVINWREGASAEVVIAEFPTEVEAELILKGAK